ncbi:major facilitator superfamily domain-containing protein [Aspergillus oleicola]
MSHWRVLAAVGAINCSGYFIYDIPASLSTPLQAHLTLPLHAFTYLISLLYTVYAIPNAVLPLFSSAAVHRFGERSVLLATVSSMILGQIVFAVAIQSRVPVGLVLGRAAVGMGGEVVGVMGIEIVSRSFERRDKSLSLALAINLGAGRLGSVANTILIPRFVARYGVVSATWIATVLVVGVAAIGLVVLLVLTSCEHEVADDKEALAVDGEDSAGLNIAAVDSPSAISQFPPVYWHLALICVLSYGCLNTFTNSAQRFLAARFYGGDQQAAGSAMSILFILSGLLVPPFGSLLDKFSSRSYPYALITSNIFLALAHSIFLSDRITSPILPLCLLGAADALLGVSLWASVVRCLTEIGTRTGPLNEYEPLVKKDVEDGLRKGGYETIRSVSSTETLADDDHHCLNSTSDEAFGQRSTSTSTDETLLIRSQPTRSQSQTQMRTLGLGIMTSLVNLSTAAVPVPLAAMENLAGSNGVEGVLLGLAVLGVLASGRVVVGGGFGR